MQFYRTDAANGFRMLAMKYELDWDVLLDFNGEHLLADSWAPPKVVYSSDLPGEKDLPKCDFPSFAVSSVLVLGEIAKKHLHGLLDGHGEFLPIVCGDENYWAFNVTNQQDLLDTENSTVDFYPSDPSTIMNIERYVLKETDADFPIFKIPELNGTDIFVSDEFKQKVEKARLSGLVFEPVS